MNKGHKGPNDIGLCAPLLYENVLMISCNKGFRDTEAQYF